MNEIITIAVDIGKIVIIIIGAALLIGAIAGIIKVRKSIYKKNHFDKDGFNLLGFDKDGFDRNGYNNKGYNRYGFDSSGYDKNGFNQYGFDKDGYDRFGFNKKGYNRKGYDRTGYDKYGYNQNGYDKNGYNKNGLDKSDFSIDYYRDVLFEMKKLHSKAYEQMRKCAYGYALHDIRIGLEKGVKCVISHLMGIPNMNSSLDDNITICKRYGLLDREFVEKLYDAKNHCNDAQHDNNIKKEYNQVYFSYKVLEELIEDVQALCVR